jgi:DNA-binding CsgD family transcriptional regulator
MRGSCTGGKLAEVGGQPEVVGRHLELEQLTAWLDRVPEGLRACVLTGPAGMGKTTVWRRGLDLARECGYRVLAARPGDAELSLSYTGLSDLVSDVEDARFATLPRVQRDALDVALLRAEAGENGVDARAVASGALSLMCGLVAVAPVLVAVDDAQWLDAPTEAALTYALRRLEAAPVGVFACVRTDELRPRTFLDSVPAERRLELELAPLSVAAVHAIFAAQLGCTLPRPLLVRVVAASGGNPFYAIEIARELVRLGEPTAAEGLPIPANLQALVRSRLARLPAETREVLLTAACVGVPRAEFLGGALGPAEEAEIVRVGRDGRVEFGHPLFAAAIRESASTARRRAVHRRLAGIVGSLEERARHLALASDGPDAAVAGELDLAAARARARGAPEEAAELAEFAIRLAPDGDDAQPERLLAAAELQFDAGGLERAQALLEQTIAGVPDGPVRARALRMLGLLHSRRSGFGEAIEFAIAARDVAEGEPALTAEIELDLAFYRSNLGDFAGGDVHARTAVDLSEEVGGDGLVASALAVRTVTAFLCGRGLAESDLRRALALADPLRETPITLRPRFVYGFLMLCTGRLDESLAMLDSLRVDTLEQGRESDVPLLFLYLVWAALWRGEVHRAAALAEEALQTAFLLDDRVADGLTLSASALASAYAGEADRARRDSTEALQHFERLGWWGGTIWARWARGFLELSLGRPDAAHEALRSLTDLLAAVGPGDPALAMFLPDEVEALVELGRADEAEALLEPFEERSRALERSWALGAAGRCRGLLNASRGDLDGALRALEAAILQHDLSPMPFERARTLLALGQVRRRRKERRLARLALEEALSVFETVGTPLWADRARAELARVATRRAPEGLTATEERIARLAAEGLTNRAIAERAFVSVKTVETNLKRAYRKLGISSRAQLARALDRQGPSTIS